MLGSPSSPIGELPAGVLATQLSIGAAWERVQRKGGMPGVDGVSVSRFAATAQSALRYAERTLADGTYRPLPLRVMVLEKKNGGRRLLLVPTVRDRVLQTAAAAWLGTKWESTFDRASFAYRPGLGVRPALRYLRELYRHGHRWVFDADIRQCFDSVDHARLFGRLERWLGPRSPLGGWLRSWVAAPVWDGRDVSLLARGIPQGSPLSPLLANFYLDDFDRRLREAGISFVRYADDFLVLAKTPFDLVPAREAAIDALAALGLTLNPDKTRTTSFDAWFRFLGAEIHGNEILLPFEKAKTPLAPVFVAPRMPPGLLRTYTAGLLRVQAQFDGDTVATKSVDVSASAAVPRSAALISLAGGPQRPSPRRG